jgi:NADPH:quinone reductase-like Zn-dependent oxidoreductase/acyl transferase domain-containing protein
MTAVALSETAAMEYLKDLTTGQVCVACINSPTSVTISGDESAVSEVESKLSANNLWYRRLKVKIAYHSPHMSYIANSYRHAISDIKPLAPIGSPDYVKMFSSLSGSQVSTTTDMGAEYWVANMLNPVRFSAAVTHLLKPTDARSKRRRAPNVNSLVEIGPHPALQGPLNNILISSPEGYDKLVTYTSILRRGQNALETALEAAGRLWSLGHNVNVRLANSTSTIPESCVSLANLPSYPWNHEQRHWFESTGQSSRKYKKAPRTDLLGLPAPDFNQLEPRWHNYLKPMEIPWLMDHKVHGAVLLPGSAMLVMAIEAAGQVADEYQTVESFELKNVQFSRAMVFQTPDHVIETSFQMRAYKTSASASSTGWTYFTLYSATNGTYVEHCDGLIRVNYVTKSSEIEDGLEVRAEWEKCKRKHAAVKQESDQEINTSGLYDVLIKSGFEFGPMFQNLTTMHAGVDQGCVTITIPDTKAVMPENYEYPLLIHPTTLDAALQVLLSGTVRTPGSLNKLPTSIGSLVVSASIPSAPNTVFYGYTTIDDQTDNDLTGSSFLSDDTFSSPMIQIRGMKCSNPGGPSSEKHTTEAKRVCTLLSWIEDFEASSHETVQTLRCGLPENFENQVNLLNKATDIVVMRAVAGISTSAVLDRSKELETYTIRLRDFASRISSPSEDVFEEEEILAAAAASSVAGEVVIHVGARLLDIVSGVIDPKGLSIETDDTTKFADDVLRTGFLNATVAAWFDKAAFKYPALRVLEISSGSVSTTISVLQKLAGRDSLPLRCGKYTYTESRQSLLPIAKESLKDYPEVDFAYLDVNLEATAQGFVNASYDVVLYTGLCQETSEIAAVLKVAKKLLRAGGTFIAGTITQSQPKTAFVLGTTAEWKPLSTQDWDSILVSNGFTGVDASVNDAEDENIQETSMIVSTSESVKTFNFNDVVFLSPRQTSPAYQTLISNISAYLSCRCMTTKEASLDSLPNLQNTVFISFVDIGGSALESMSEETFIDVKSLLTKSAGVLWVTNSNMKEGSTLPSAGIATGLLRTVRAEAPHLRLANLDFSHGFDLGSGTSARLLLHVFEKTFANDLVEKDNRDNEFAEAGGRLYVPRMILESSLNAEITQLGEAARPQMDKLFQPGRPLKIEIGEPGILDTFRFTDQLLCFEPLPDDYVLIRVRAAGLNFLDLMTALAQVPNKKTGFGSEVVGIIEEVGSAVTSKFKVGDTVVAVVEEGFATHVRIGETALQHLPDGMSETDAVSCVVTYITAYSCLIELARLSQGESVLIHAAAGGVGQAAIQLAQYIGAEIFATVGSTQKKELLRDKYGIPESHIFNSRDTTFAKGVMRVTNGNGVDVVLNSTHGEALQESWNCLADFGRFVEIGKRDIIENNGLEMKNFLRNVWHLSIPLPTYHANVR